MSVRLDRAFVLAAGLGTRMRPLTSTLPKPLVRLRGKALIDHVLDRIVAAGIGQAVVNVHYLADQIEAHLRDRRLPRIAISDERERLLDTGGGVVAALPLLGQRPFLVHNSDTVWIEREVANISRLAAGFDETRMDAVLLLADRRSSLGYHGNGDFHLAGDGRLKRVGKGDTADYVFAGASISSLRLLRQPPTGAFSLNVLWDRAMAEGRLFGVPLEGIWMHVGDPASLAAAEAQLESTSEPGSTGS